MTSPQNIPNPSVPPQVAVPPSPTMAMGGMPPQAPPPMPPMNPNYAEGGEMGGGSKSNPIKDFFSDINIVEAGILALGVATFLYAIYYYKFEMQLSKTGYADLNGRMTKLESDMKKKEATANANANGQGGGRARMRKRIMF
jgi:hypothetical protein